MDRGAGGGGEFVDLIAYHCEAAPLPGDAGLAWPDAHTHEAVRSRAVKAQLEAGWAARTSPSTRPSGLATLAAEHYLIRYPAGLKGTGASTYRCPNDRSSRRPACGQ